MADETNVSGGCGTVASSLSQAELIIGACVQVVGHTPVCQILLQILVRTSVIKLPPLFYQLSLGCYLFLQPSHFSGTILLQPFLHAL